MSFDIKQLLAENLERLMQQDALHTLSQAELAKRSKVDQRYIGRLLKAENYASVKILEKIAKAFDLQPWQLLVPHMDPSHPPVINHLTEAEKRLYERLKEAARLVMDSDQQKYGD